MVACSRDDRMQEGLSNTEDGGSRGIRSEEAAEEAGAPGRQAKREETNPVREQNTSLAERLTAAVRFPVLHCRINNSFEDEGMGWLLFSRELPGGRVAVASFLVDRYCLGVKDVFGEVLSRPEYDSKYIRRMAAEMPAHSIPPADARKLLEEAVAYAHSLGLAPHADYPKVLPLFGSIDPAESKATFEFGKDGKPLFIAGPSDTPERSRAIVGILTENCGTGNFHYLVPLGGSHGRDIRFLDAEEDDFDDDDFEDD